MKVFLVGATGAIGRELVPLLVARGHEVVATTRSQEKTSAVGAMGAEPVVLDALDRETVLDAVTRARPEAIVHQATALTGVFNLKHFSRTFEQTNRLRTVGTDNLVAAARAAGARRVVAQGFAGWPYASDGSALRTEEDPFEPSPPEEMRSTVHALRHLETAVLGTEDLEGIVLRYGGFYGPGTSLGDGGAMVEAVRKRQLPIVGDGAGVTSFLHVEDAAGATVVALERGAPGVYNIVDDEPAPSSVWVPELAKAVGAKPPRHVPVWLAKPLIGDAGVWLMTKAPGASNAKAKTELGWTPRYASWRIGFRDGLGVETEMCA
ncbi:MAG: NAD-dependent epimerase/dehydratase [Actinomycetia bacterium]|nr:NAD-dependent epimerase/dehydratase [Actinomycetes bacterium]